MGIKQGDLVEFTRKPILNGEVYTVGEGTPDMPAEFGVAVQAEDPYDGSVRVELSDGSTYVARYIHACGWHGWMPEELEDAYMRHQPPCLDESDYY